MASSWHVLHRDKEAEVVDQVQKGCCQENIQALPKVPIVFW